MSDDWEDRSPQYSRQESDFLDKEEASLNELPPIKPISDTLPESKFFREAGMINKKEMVEVIRIGILLWLAASIVSRLKEINEIKMKPEPPSSAEFIVGLFAKKYLRESLLGSLSEDFDRDVAAGVSLRRAQFRYWAAALNSIGPQAVAALKRIGLVGLVFDYARRWMG